VTHAAGPGIGPEFPRVRPPGHYDESMLAFLRTTKFYDQGRPLNAHQVLSNHPPAGRSLNRFLDWGDDAVLSARERRLLILRTASRARCEYELSVHRQQGVRNGDVSTEEVSALDAGLMPVPESLSPRELALLAIADAICRTDTLDEEQWTAAVRVLTVQDIIECLVVVGYYRMCSGVMNALAVPPEGDMSPAATAVPPVSEDNN
jgi:alkylhydroperoxidase family enzyme